MGSRRRTHYAQLSRWTPRAAARFAKARLDRIDDLLVEIGSTYGDVDNFIVTQVDRLRDEVRGLNPAIDEALAEERTL